MDPMSIVPVAGAVVKLAYSCSKSLYRFISDTRVVGASIKALHDELEHLQLTAKTVESDLQRPGLDVIQGAKLWKNAGVSLRACEASLHNLEDDLPRLQVSDAPKRRNQSSSAAQSKLNIREDETQKACVQLHSHHLALQLIAQMIIIHISSKGPSLVCDELAPLLENFERVLTLLHEDNLAKAQSNTRNSTAIHNTVLSTRRVHVHLERTAQDLISEVRLVIDETRSTSFYSATSEVEFASRTSSTVTFRESGSLTGARKPNTSFSPIVGSIRSPERKIALHDSASDMTSVIDIFHDSNPFHQPSSSHRLDKSSESVDEQAKGVDDRSEVVDQRSEGVEERSDGADEPDVELDIINDYINLARIAAHQGDHFRAEKLLQKALAKPHLLSKLDESTTEANLQLELANSLLMTHSYTDGRKICDRLLKENIQNHTDLARVLDAAYILAQIHYAEGTYDIARRNCRKALKGRNRLTGKKDAYYSAVALMVAISKQRGDEEECNTYEAMLPARFERPMFDSMRASRPISRAEVVSILRERLNEEISTRLSSAMTPFHWAAAQGDLERVRHLLGAGQAIDEATSFTAYTALHIAVLCQNNKIVKFLLQCGASVNQGDRGGHTALSMATESGSKDLVQVLLEEGANVDAVSEDRRTPLYMATVRGDEVIVRLLIQKGASLDTFNYKSKVALLQNAKPRGYEAVLWQLVLDGKDIESSDDVYETALHSAITSGSETIAQLLLENGASAAIKNTYGSTPLHYAAEGGCEAIVRLLLMKGASVSSHDDYLWTPLHNASKQGHEAIVRLLLKKGASIDASNRLGWTSLHFAISENHEAIIRLLLKKGASSHTGDVDGWTPLHEAAAEGHETVVRLLLEKGASVDILTGREYTPLHIAAANDHEMVVRLLLVKGASIDALDEQDWTPLHRAAYYGQEVVVRLLLKNGASIDALTLRDWTPLHCATDEGHEAVVRLLLEKGASIDMRTRSGLTSLHFAARQGEEVIAQLLIEKGAGIDILDEDGETPLHYAAYNGTDAVVRILLEKGANRSLKTRDGETALDVAKRRYHQSTVTLLERAY